ARRRTFCPPGNCERITLSKAGFHRTEESSGPGTLEGQVWSATGHPRAADVGVPAQGLGDLAAAASDVLRHRGAGDALQGDDEIAAAAAVGPFLGVRLGVGVVVDDHAVNAAGAALAATVAGVARIVLGDDLLALLQHRGDL